MVKIVKASQADFDAKAAEFLIEGVVALPTGNTPLGMYRLLRERKIDWSKIKIFMLDAFYPQEPNDPTSFASYMKTNLPGVELNILDSNPSDPEKECQAYEAKIKQAGGLDLAILGIGPNGHIAFNESGTDPNLLTHKTRLVNQPFEFGLTMGIKTIMVAKKIVLLAKGANKAAAVKAALTPPPVLICPASWLQNHPDCTFLIDQEAAAKL